jgi:hypothetical protein
MACYEDRFTFMFLLILVTEFVWEHGEEMQMEMLQSEQKSISKSLKCDCVTRMHSSVMRLAFSKPDTERTQRNLRECYSQLPHIWQDTKTNMGARYVSSYIPNCASSKYRVTGANR